MITKLRSLIFVSGFLIIGLSLLSINQVESFAQENTTLASGTVEGQNPLEPQVVVEEDATAEPDADFVPKNAETNSNDEEQNSTGSLDPIGSLQTNLVPGPLGLRSVSGLEFYNIQVNPGGNLLFRANSLSAGTTRFIINDHRNGTVRIPSGNDSALGSGGFLILGPTNGANVSIDNNEIMARNNGNASPLFLNHNGGNIVMGAGSASGRVGIGTSVPYTRLTMNGPIGFKNSTSSMMYIFQSGTLNAERPIISHSPSFPFWGLSYRDNGDVMAFRRSSTGAGSNVMTVNLANGRVGIGTAAPSALLTVNGPASKPGGGSWSVFSDERLKDIQGTFDSGLKEVLKLQPIRYNYKKGNSLELPHNNEYIGLSAQEVQKVIPEAVKSNKGYLQLTNDPVFWAMLNAIKEQQAQIEQLKATNVDTEVDYVTIKAENKQLKASLSALTDRQDILEGMFLAISANRQNNKLVSYDKAGFDEVQMDVE